MYIKDTNEFISSRAHVFESIEKHMGYEYTEAIKTIIESIPEGYTHNEDVEKMERGYQQEIDSYQESLSQKDGAFSDIQELCDNFIETVEDAKRLSRKDIIKKIEEIKNIAYRAY